MFLRRFPEIENMRVLDLGGTVHFWRHAAIAPADLTILNIHHDPSEAARIVIGDACEPPATIAEERYDLVFCNSVIDQVGGFHRRKQLAAVVQELAPHHWVQTAYRYFPIDAYFLFPGFAQLPLAGRVAIARRWSATLRHARSFEEVGHNVLAVELLSQTELKLLFPDSELLVERLLGIPKSLIAMR